MSRQLETERLAKSFGGVRALAGLDLAVETGELVGLIGPNGSGKTTLLNIVGGYYRPTSGMIRYEGRRIDSRSPAALARMGIGRSFQVTKVFRRLSLLENLLVPGLVDWQAGRAEAVAKAEGILDALNLTRLKHEPASNLSGGQAKLLEFGRIMMLDPRLVLLDEPFGGVHPELKQFMYEKVREWNTAGVTIVLVSHDMGSIFGLSRRVVTLSSGELIADGPPEAVRNDPRVIEAYLGEHHRAA